MIALDRVFLNLNIVASNVLVKMRQAVDYWVCVGINHIDTFEDVVERFERTSRIRIPHAYVSFDRPELEHRAYVFGQDKVEEFVHARERFGVDEALECGLVRFIRLLVASHGLGGEVAAQAVAKY